LGYCFRGKYAFLYLSKKNLLFKCSDTLYSKETHIVLGQLGTANCLPDFYL